MSRQITDDDFRGEVCQHLGGLRYWIKELGAEKDFLRPRKYFAEHLDQLANDLAAIIERPRMVKP